jgi:hypothetical protein
MLKMKRYSLVIIAIIVFIYHQYIVIHPSILSIFDYCNHVLLVDHFFPSITIIITPFYYVGNAGTAMRPLVGVLSAGHGHFVLDGVPRMRERPIIDLVDGLKQVCKCHVN